MIQQTFLRKENLDRLKSRGVEPLQELFDMSKMKTSGTVIIRSTRESKYKRNHLSFRSFQGYEFDDTSKTRLVYFGIPIQFNSDTSQYRFSQIQIDGQKTFNLANLQEAVEFHILKHHEWMKGSPNSLGDTRFEIVDNEKDAIDRRKKGILIAKALAYVNSVQDDEVDALAYVYGLDPIMLSVNEIFAKLTKDATEKPGDIIRLFEQDKIEKKNKEAFQKAITYGLIKEHPVQGFMFRDNLSIGMTKPEAIEYLRKEPTVTQWILAETERLINSSKQAAIKKGKEVEVAKQKLVQTFAPNKEKPVKDELISAKDLLKDEEEPEDINHLKTDIFETQIDATGEIVDSGPKIIGDDDDDLDLNM